MGMLQTNVRYAAPHLTAFERSSDKRDRGVSEGVRQYDQTVTWIGSQASILRRSKRAVLNSRRFMSCFPPLAPQVRKQLCNLSLQS